MNERMLEMATAARERAYAPYSGYKVGAAVLASGEIYAGCNVENAAYGSTMCAERAALFAMVSAGIRTPEALLLMTEDGAKPCGACLQVLAEFAADPSSFPIHFADVNGLVRTVTLADCLPHGFHSLKVNRTESGQGTV